MSNSNVFEQYQKYFDSLITRHKEACKLENQNAHQIPSVPQQQQQQQPLQQSQPQQQQQPLQQSQPQQQQQQQTPIAIRRQQMPPTTHQPEIDMYGSRRRQQPPPQRYDDYDQELDYGYYGRGGRAMMDQPWPRRQPMRPPPPPPPSQYHPDDYCRYYYNNRYRDYPAEPMTLQSQSPPPPPPPTTSAFRPDGRVDPSPEDVEKKKPTFCYPNGVSGYQGGGPCGPCTSCNAKSPTDDSGSDNPVTLQQKLQQRQKQVSDRPQQQQQQEQQSPQRQQQKPCEGQNCADVWPSASSAAAAGAAVAAAAAKSDAPQERLPLGVTEPFVVGPTSYQYFFDSNLA